MTTYTLVEEPPEADTGDTEFVRDRPVAKTTYVIEKKAPAAYASTGTVTLDEWKPLRGTFTTWREIIFGPESPEVREDILLAPGLPAPVNGRKVRLLDYRLSCEKLDSAIRPSIGFTLGVFKDGDCLSFGPEVALLGTAPYTVATPPNLNHMKVEAPGCAFGLRVTRRASEWCGSGHRLVAVFTYGVEEGGDSGAEPADDASKRPARRSRLVSMVGF